MTDLERVIEATLKATQRLAELAQDSNPIYRGAHVAMKILLQELNAVAKAEEKADG